MSYSATQLTYEVLESPPPTSASSNTQQPAVVDTLSLSKPLGWTPPSQAAQSALYSSIPVTPEPTGPFTDTSTATLVYLLKCLLLPEAVVEKLAARYLAPGSEAWSGVYNQRTEWIPNEQWATTVAFLDVMKAMGPGFEQFEVYKVSGGGVGWGRERERVKGMRKRKERGVKKKSKTLAHLFFLFHPQTVPKKNHLKVLEGADEPGREELLSECYEWVRRDRAGVIREKVEEVRRRKKGDGRQRRERRRRRRARFSFYFSAPWCFFFSFLFFSFFFIMTAGYQKKKATFFSPSYNSRWGKGGSTERLLRCCFLRDDDDGRPDIF